MIELRKTIELAKKILSEANIDFALIGGFALSVHGVHRATQDIDILVDGDHKEKVEELFLHHGFKEVFKSDEVLQLKGVGLLDILFANRPLSLEMIKLASVDQSLQIPVVSAEALIGLKIQAYKNDASRELQDKADIKSLLQLPSLNMAKVKEYADLFNAWPEIEELK